MNIRTKINNQITAPELRIIDDNGDNLGIISRDEAIKIAKDKGLDLIEISPTAKPPVAKIMSFDKFRYTEMKREKKQRQGQKASELKQMRISARAALNDLQVKANKVNKFLEENHKVEINLVLRGREKQNKDWARKKLQEFLKILVPHKALSDMKFGHKGFSIQVSK